MARLAHIVRRGVWAGKMRCPQTQWRDVGKFPPPPARRRLGPPDRRVPALSERGHPERSVSVGRLWQSGAFRRTPGRSPGSTSRSASCGSLPLDAGDKKVWVRRAGWAAAEDHQAIQIHVSWITGPTGAGSDVIHGIAPHTPWRQAVGEIAGRQVVAAQQNTRARRANPFEAETFAIPDATVVFVAHLTTCDAQERPIEDSRYT